MMLAIILNGVAEWFGALHVDSPGILKLDSPLTRTAASLQAAAAGVQFAQIRSFVISAVPFLRPRPIGTAPPSPTDLRTPFSTQPDNNLVLYRATIRAYKEDNNLVGFNNGGCGPASRFPRMSFSRSPSEREPLLVSIWVPPITSAALPNDLKIG